MRGKEVLCFGVFMCTLVLRVQGYKAKLGEDGFLEWSNSYLAVKRTANLVPGSPFSIGVVLFGDTFESISLKTPHQMETHGKEQEGGRISRAWETTKVENESVTYTFDSYDPAQDAGTFEWEIRLSERPESEVQILRAYVSTLEEVPVVRLMEDIYPTSYNLFLAPNMSSDVTEDGSTWIEFSGSVEMALTVECEDCHPCVRFHADEMEILHVWFTKDEEILLPISELGFDLQSTLVEACLPEGFDKSSNYYMHVDFEVSTLREGYYQYGLYYKPCTLDYTKNCWFTQGEATNARNIFPCWDEPGFKAKIKTGVLVPEGFDVLSNMPLSGKDYLEEGVLYSFQESPDMSAYLFALAITDYIPAISEVREGVTVWSSKEDYMAGRADYSADIGARIINFYGDLFDIDYTLPKLDLVVEEMKYGAMENWGLVLFDPETILLDPLYTEVEGLSETRWLVSSVVAHELAHQWFGNLVTLNWWGQMWLNEGFATYVSYLGAEQVDPSNLPWERLLVEETFRVMQEDSDTTYHWAMTDSVSSREDIERMFGLFSYNKGCSIIRMMEGIMGRSTLIKGLTNYLSEFSYLSTTEDDLFDVLEITALEDGKWPGSYTGGKSFSEVMKTWTNQAGYPLITATTQCTRNATSPSEKNSSNQQNSCKLSLRQEWFVTRGSTDSSERLWTVPVFVQPSAMEDPVIYWLEGSGEEIFDLPEDHNPEDPLVINADAIGYYRVTYDEENWRKIGETLQEDKTLIPAFSRAEIACDLAVLVNSGDLSEQLYSDVMSGWQVKEEEQVVQWSLEFCSNGFKTLAKKTWRI